MENVYLIVENRNIGMEQIVHSVQHKLKIVNHVIILNPALYVLKDGYYHMENVFQNVKVEHI